MSTPSGGCACCRYGSCKAATIELRQTNKTVEPRCEKASRFDSLDVCEIRPTPLHNDHGKALLASFCVQKSSQSADRLLAGLSVSNNVCRDQGPVELDSADALVVILKATSRHESGCYEWADWIGWSKDVKAVDSELKWVQGEAWGAAQNHRV